MEHRFLIRSRGKVFKVFKVAQHANGDITIIPYKSVYLNSDFIDRYDYGEKLMLTVDHDDLKIDHYSAHSRTGQRHVKFNPAKPAVEPIRGEAFQNIQNPVPLGTILATTQTDEDEEPTKGKWSGIVMPDDTDYCTFEIFAVPLNVPVNFNVQHNIQNTKQSVETMFHVVIPLRTLGIAVVARTSNHNQCTIPVNVFVQQRIGKTAQIVRVDGKELDVQISSMSIQRPQATEGESTQATKNK